MAVTKTQKSVFPNWLAMLAVCALLGVATGWSPVIGLSAGLLLVFIVVTLEKPWLALAGLMVAIHFEALSPHAYPALTPIKIFGGAFIAVVALRWLIASRSGRGFVQAKVPGTRTIVIALAVFFAFSVASMGWAANVAQVRSVCMLLALDMFVLLGVWLVQESTFEFLAAGWGMLAGATVATASGLITGANLNGRFIGMVKDSNEYSMLTAVAIVLALPTIFLSRSNWLRIISVAAMIFLAFGLVFSQSRTGVIIVVVGTLIFLAFADRQTRNTGLMVGIPLLAMAVLITFSTPAGDAFVSRVKADGDSGRSDLNRVAVKQFKSSPVRGVGMGNYMFNVREHLDADVEQTALFLRAPRTVHNVWLMLLAETGIVGATLFTVFFTAVIYQLGVARRRIKKAVAQGIDSKDVRELTMMTAAAGACLTMWVVTSLLQPVLLVEWFWITCGLCMAVTRATFYRLSV